jgi:hypothetical protein
MVAGNALDVGTPSADQRRDPAAVRGQAHGFEYGPVRPAGHGDGDVPGPSVRFPVELVESGERHYHHHWEMLRGTREPAPTPSMPLRVKQFIGSPSALRAVAPPVLAGDYVVYSRVV